MWPLFILRQALAVAAGTIKNPQSKEAQYLRQVMLALYQQIKITYAGDPDFS